VDAVLRLKGSSNLESIHIIKKTGGTLKVLPPATYKVADYQACCPSYLIMHESSVKIQVHQHANSEVLSSMCKL